MLPLVVVDSLPDTRVAGVQAGVATGKVDSGKGLNMNTELRLLRAITDAPVDPAEWQDVKDSMAGYCRHHVWTVALEAERKGLIRFSNMSFSVGMVLLGPGSRILRMAGW